MTHAIFKAAAFLAAGAILHTVDSRFMGDMGGLRKPMKITFAAMVISLLALSGVPPLSGFWSKDAVIATAVLTGQPGLMILAWATVALTFMYSLKLIGMVFLGPKSEHLRKREEEGHHLHEAPPVMLIPYVILAVATIIFGLAGPYVEAFIKQSLTVNATPLIGSIPTSAAAESHAVLIGSLGSLAMLVVGGTIGYLVYISCKVKPGSIVGETGAMRSVYNFLWNRWYINPIYYRVFVYGTISVATDLWRSVELSFFDRISGAVASLSLGISRDGQGVDLNAIDSAINGIASYGRKISLTLKKIQTGIPQDYVTIFVIGLFALIVAILFFRI
jgi:NADH-quinone oxidoreductase subunit L